MHWTLRVLVATACLASLTWAGQLRGNKGNKVESQANVEQDEVLAIDPEERIITVGNAEGLGVFLVQLSTMTVLLLAAIYCIYVVFLPSVSNRSLPWSPWDILGQVGGTIEATDLLRRVTESIDSVNSRMASEERAVCRKMSLCQMGNMTSGFRYVHTFLEILRPVFPQIDDNWEGLLAGEAREDCNILYPECPGAILRAMFAEVY
ncbi:uncharacterized protein LOC123508589 isoform X2 [Portunus trituberculatus]|uniref:uncharacterized protein LOC123508589 isoform X2 n=1 Tax=Portunus trituberculatus TaxID=210409 RepID=UPI001E1CC399|nr:uncharacterized protein LOC123508589 isoform X2 [Portunus trituberculatus]